MARLSLVFIYSEPVQIRMDHMNVNGPSLISTKTGGEIVSQAVFIESL